MSDENVRDRREMLMQAVGEGDADSINPRDYTEKLLAEAAEGDETRSNAREHVELFINAITGGSGGGSGFDYFPLTSYLLGMSTDPDIENVYLDILSDSSFAPLVTYLQSKGASATSPSALCSESVIVACAVALACFFQNPTAYSETEITNIMSTALESDNVGVLYGSTCGTIAASNGFATVFDNIRFTASIAYVLLVFASIVTHSS